MMGVEAIAGLLGLVALACFIQGPWQAYCTDKARQALFAKRAELFYIACANDVSFDSDVYIMVRKHIEGLIRFAHHLTWARFVLLLPFVGRLDLGNAPNASKEIAKISNEQIRRSVQDIYDKSGLIMIEMIIYKSPTLFALLSLARVIFRGAKGCIKALGGGSSRMHKLTMHVVQLMQRTQVIIRVGADSTPY